MLIYIYIYIIFACFWGKKCGNLSWEMRKIAFLGVLFSFIFN